MNKVFTLKPENIINLSLKLEGKLPINRDELLALVSSWGRNTWVFTKDKNDNEILIDGCEANKKYDLSNLDVSEISNFNEIFRESNFKGDINGWDVSKATSMDLIFANTKEFNSPLNKWDVSNVTSMKSMFCEAEKFNKNINSWDVSKVTTMYSFFAYAKNFNQPLDKWNTSLVTSMYAMFCYATKFNQNINSWNISNVTNINNIFACSKSFNQPVLWDISNIEACYSIFTEAQAFQNRFNKGFPLSFSTYVIKDWLIENRDKMIAIDIENNKKNDLDDFLLNLNNKKNYDRNI